MRFCNRKRIFVENSHDMNTLAQEVLSVPLNNAQLELLKMFASSKSYEFTEEDILEIKRFITRFWAKKLEEETDRVWEERNLTQEDMDRWLHTHERTPYRRKQG
jgi:hypothetical protein